MNKKFKIQEVRTVLNRENGDIIQESTTKKAIFEAEPPYVKMYLEDISRLKQLPQSTNSILTELLSAMNYNNVVPMYKPIKDMICYKLGLSLHTLNKSIDELYRKGILIRKARGLYLLDPHLFGRGTWNDIKQIRLTVDYSNGERQLRSSITKQIDLFENE